MGFVWERLVLIAPVQNSISNQLQKAGIFINPRLQNMIARVFSTPVQTARSVRRRKDIFYGRLCCSYADIRGTHNRSDRMSEIHSARS